jgi:guanylate kinase
VKSSKLPCKYVFIAPPSMEVLENRLRNRGTESEENILIRLATASQELQYGVTVGNFDAIIVNNDIETAVADVIQHLRSSYPSFDFDIGTNVSN